MRVRSRVLLLFLPLKREKLYHVCSVDDASGGTDHTATGPANVECTEYARGREEGKELLGRILAAEPQRGIRMCTLARGLAPRATHTRAKPRVHRYNCCHRFFFNYLISLLLIFLIINIWLLIFPKRFRDINNAL